MPIKFIYNAIYLLPLVTILSIMLSYLIPLASYIPFIVFAYVIIMSCYKRKSTITLNNYILLLYFYCLLLIPLSSDLYGAITETHKMIFVLMMYPIGLNYFKNYDQIIKLNKIIYIVGIIFVCEQIFANIFGTGRIDYESLDFYVGLLSRVHSHIAVLPVILIPMIIFIHKDKKLQKALMYIVGILCLVMLIYMMRRAPILISFTGLSIIFIYLLYKSKIKYRFYVLSVIIIFLGPIYYSSDFIIDRLEERSVSFSEPLTEQLYKEGRSREFAVIFNKLTSFEDPSMSFFGKEIFNMDYHSGRYVQYGSATVAYAERSLHTSFARIGSGTGIVGLMLYFLVMIKIYSIYIKYKAKIKIIDPKLSTAFATFNALFFIAIFELYSSSYFHLTFMPFLFLYLGALTGIIKSYSKSAHN